MLLEIADAFEEGGNRLFIAAVEDPLANPARCHEAGALKHCEMRGNGRLRQAAAAAIDLNQLDERLNQGKANYDSALLSPNSRWYSGTAGPKYDLETAERRGREAGLVLERSWLDGERRFAVLLFRPAR